MTDNQRYSVRHQLVGDRLRLARVAGVIADNQQSGAGRARRRIRLISEAACSAPR